MSAEFWDDIEGRTDEVGFQRSSNTGAPWVNHPTRQTKDRPTRAMYGRPSSAYVQIDNRFNLEKWSERMTLLGALEMMRNGEILSSDMDVVLNYNADDKDHRQHVDSLVAEAKRRAGAMLAAEQGTQRHLLTEHHDEDRDLVATIEAGVDLGISPAVSAAVVTAWQKLIDHYRIEILDVEMSVVDDEFNLAGTLDRIGRTTVDITLDDGNGDPVTIPAGTVLVVDLKTGKLTLDRQERPQHWTGYALQIASYAKGHPYGFGDNEGRRRWGWRRKPSQTHAVIAHIDANEERVEARLVYVNLAAGREGLRLVKAAKAFARRKDVIGRATAPPVTVTVQ